MLLGQPPRPPAGQRPAQRLGLAGPGKRRACAFVDETVQTGEQLRVRRLPVEIVFPGALAEDEPHSATVRPIPPPCSSSAMASLSRSPSLALRNRWRVSSYDPKSSRDTLP